MSDTIEMTIGVSMVLNEVLNVLLNDENGQSRKLPFRLQTKLVRNKAILEKDYQQFQVYKNSLILKYGEKVEDNVKIVDVSKQKMYKKDIEASLETIVTHEVVKILPEEFDKITCSIDISNEALLLCYQFLVDDIKFLDDLNTEIVFNKSKKRKGKNKR